MHNRPMQEDKKKAHDAGPSDAWLEAFISREALPAGIENTIRQHFGGVASWLRHRCASERPYTLGINGAQGSGKTTLARYLRDVLQQEGLNVAMLSLDDFYLSRAARTQLAETVHPLLAIRGVPGTHDTALLHEVFAKLQVLAAGVTLEWPVFDKSADDRSTSTQSFAGPADIILLEGWCVGTPPEPAESLAAPLNPLESTQDADGRWRAYVNRQLATVYTPIFELLDGLCFLAVPDFNAVLRWRLEQEHKLIERTGRGMSDDQVALFIQHFERLTRRALHELPLRADCVLEFDAEHRCIRSRFRDPAC